MDTEFAQLSIRIDYFFILFFICFPYHLYF